MAPFYPPWNGPVNPYYTTGNPSVYIPPQHHQPQHHPPQHYPPAHYQQQQHQWSGPPPGWGPGPAVQPPTSDFGGNPQGYYQQQQQHDLKPSDFKSQKYPGLSAILARDSTLLRFNVTDKPSRAILTSTYYTYRHLPANTTPVKMMRLVSRCFPWTIDIPSQHDVTCEMVWDALWAGLQEPLADSEWGLICGDEKRMGEMRKAHKKRVEGNSNNPDRRVKRCDYLGDEVWFRGLEKDDEYQRLRLLPGAKDCADTWTVILDSK